MSLSKAVGSGGMYCGEWGMGMGGRLYLNSAPGPYVIHCSWAADPSLPHIYTFAYHSPSKQAILKNYNKTEKEEKEKS
jgi:hypothetical protein